jgi:AcrR family transcriptional regulator
MSPTVKPRTYRSTRRTAQAGETREAILAAARRLFAERGYAGTGMSQIAGVAGVAVQTLYASVGSKRAILFALLDVMDRDAAVGAYRGEMARADSPVAVVGGAVGLTRRLQERSGDIIAAVRSAAPIEPDLAAVLAEGQRRHRVGAASVARRLADLGALREGLGVDDAAATLALLTGDGAWDELIRLEGRSWDAAEAFVLRTACRALLSDP